MTGAVEPSSVDHRLSEMCASAAQSKQNKGQRPCSSAITNSPWLDTPDPAEAFEAVKVKTLWAENQALPDSRSWIT
jgi:hypothetical protein